MNVKDSLLNTLASAGGEYVSGAVLAESLGVSRNAVWKAVKSLEAEGYVIESAASKGYRLADSNNRLSAELILSHLPEDYPCRTVKVFSEVGSTNTAAKELASAGAPDGTIVTADSQTAGKGRLGRSFVSPPGSGLYMSVIVRPELELSLTSMLTTAAAAAVAEAVEDMSGADTRIKWVNDIYIGGKKICGILTEASLGLEMKALDYAVIGIGVNVSGTFSGELAERATSVEAECGVRPDRNALCAGIAVRLRKYIGTIEQRGFLPEYRRRELLTGNMITANVGNESITGKALGIDDNANLIIELPDGSVKHLGSGEANLCRIKKD
ncbi:MAG: biotin--[Ruminococcus sp.]|nr:biotin--[acetyl-CoA-carboxylase] ligase [Ruminococcus sp.]